MEQFSQKLRSRLELLRLIPDLSLRTTFVILSLCLIGIAYSIGELHGRSVEAERSLAVVGALPFVPWSDRVLDPPMATRGGIAPSAQKFVASANGKSYYPASCRSASRIKEENRIWFATEEDARLSGRTLAKGCLP